MPSVKVKVAGVVLELDRKHVAALLRYFSRSWARSRPTGVTNKQVRSWFLARVCGWGRPPAFTFAASVDQATRCRHGFYPRGSFQPQLDKPNRTIAAHAANVFVDRQLRVWVRAGVLEQPCRGRFRKPTTARALTTVSTRTRRT